MAEWVTALVAILGGIGGLGGVLSIFLFYGENKRAKQLENEHKANAEYADLVAQYKQRTEDLEKRLDDLTKKAGERETTLNNKIDSLYKENNELKRRNDKLSSKVAVLTILRCKVVGCGQRQPPIGMRDPEEPEAQLETSKPDIIEQPNNEPES